MSDHALRTTERLSYDDPEAAAHWLAQRVRAGEVLEIRCPEVLDGFCHRCNGTGSLPVEETLALLAYVGHEPARVLRGRLNWGALGEHRDLAAWAQGLTRWGRPVAVRAALAAARGALEADWTGWRKRETNAPQALAAVEACLADPTEERRQAWSEAWLATNPVAGGPAERDWLPRPPGWDQVATIQCAAQALGGPDGPQRIRAAVCRALVEWALGGDE